MCQFFSQVCVSPDSESVMEDSVKEHSEPLQHYEKYKLQQKSDLGADVFMESVALNSPLGKIVLLLREDDKDGLDVMFGTVYHNKKLKPMH